MGKGEFFVLSLKTKKIGIALIDAVKQVFFSTEKKKAEEEFEVKIKN